MKSRILLCALLSFFSVNALAAEKAVGCEKWLKAINAYEDIVGGKIVMKFSIFNFMNWDANDQFEKAVLIKSVPKGQPSPVLEVSYKSGSSGKSDFQVYKVLAPFELDPKLKEFDDFKPKQLFRYQEHGTFTLRLKSGDTELCSHTGRYGADD